VNDGKADSTRYRGTVIRAYNGAENEMPETFTRLKRTLNDKQRQVEFIEDEQTTADFVVIVGSKTASLKP
jgi:hypothetical protein